MKTLKMHSLDGVQRNIELIGKLFPNAITEVKRDGKVEHAIDFDVLRQELSDSIVEGREERYQFTWPDKKKAMLAANAPITATLRPVVADSVGKDGTPGGFDSENLYIEGDNLEVLKLLQETYLGKVKMIYIDPPYNTGNDFVYEDDFAQSAADYMDNSGQYDEEGNRLVTNTESNGRFHTDWLNMIYPRLKLAKDLLADNGAIFISIDENEMDNLRKICDDVFGESNFIGQFIWQRRTSPDMRKLVSTAHDYIVTYGKNTGNLSNTINKVRLTEKDAANYSNPDNDPRGPWASSDFTAQGFRPNQMYEITTPGGAKYTPPEGRCWKNIESEFLKQCEEGRMWFGKDGMGIPRRKTYLSEREGKNVWTWWPNSEVGHSQEATQEVKNLFDGHAYFDYPKPVRLLKKIIQIGTHDDSIVLDFFSGSATTAHAMIQLNTEDNGHRKFILVQLPEMTAIDSDAYKAGYKNICEIGKERIRRAGKQILSAGGGQLEMSETQPEPGTPVDVGFRCLRLDSSNMENVYYTPEEISQQDMFSLVDNVKSDRTPEDLLFQVMLDLGVLLSSPIEVKETVKAIAQMKPYYAVFRDSSMANDSVATNFDQIFETYSPETVRKVL